MRMTHIRPSPPFAAPYCALSSSALCPRAPPLFLSTCVRRPAAAAAARGSDLTMRPTGALACACALLALVASTSAQVPFFGSCPRPPFVTNFQASSYLGRWYEYSKYFTFFEIGLKCIQAVYTDAGSGNIGVNNRGIKILTGAASDIQGVAVPVGQTGEAKLRVSFEGVPSFGGDSGEANYIVLDTDYCEYAIVWSCSDFRLFNTQFLFVLTRDQFPSTTLVSAILQQIRALGLNTSKLIQTDQTDCPGNGGRNTNRPRC